MAVSRMGVVGRRDGGQPVTGSARGNASGFWAYENWRCRPRATIHRQMVDLASMELASVAVARRPTAVVRSLSSSDEARSAVSRRPSCAIASGTCHNRAGESLRF
jgi:hypothetical protein